MQPAFALQGVGLADVAKPRTAAGHSPPLSAQSVALLQPPAAEPSERAGALGARALAAGALCAAALAGAARRGRRAAARGRRRWALGGRGRTSLRQQIGTQTLERKPGGETEEDAEAQPPSKAEPSPAAAPDVSFTHPPRSERQPKKLPFTEDDFEVYPKALFPWSPERGGRPWDAWLQSHKVRLAFVSSVHLGALAAPFCFSWGAFAVFAALVVATTIGVTLSFHRQLSHKAFECPKWLEYLFAYFGCLAVEGAPIGWVRMHRYHHLHSDKEHDVHSPFDGLLWAHMGFMFDASTPEKLGDVDNCRDMQRQEFYQLMENSAFYVASSVVLPILALYALGGLPYVVWGFCLRQVWIWHATWGVNSLGHVYGYQSYRSGDNSQNNWFFGLVGFGDGWHNNHHAFPRSCRHGFEWWEVDMNWNLLQLLEAVGLAWNLQLPCEERKKRLALDD